MSVGIFAVWDLSVLLKKICRKDLFLLRALVKIIYKFEGGNEIGLEVSAPT